MVTYNASQAFRSCDSVSLGFDLGGVDAIPGEELEGIEEVEETACNGVDDGGEDDCEHVIGHDGREKGRLRMEFAGL